MQQAHATLTIAALVEALLHEEEQRHGAEREREIREHVGGDDRSRQSMQNIARQDPREA